MVTVARVRQIQVSFLSPASVARVVGLVAGKIVVGVARGGTVVVLLPF